MKGRRRSSIYLMKVAGALVKLKGTTNHSNNPLIVLKDVFHTSVDLIDKGHIFPMSSPCGSLDVLFPKKDDT